MAILRSGTNTNSASTRSNISVSSTNSSALYRLCIVLVVWMVIFNPPLFGVTGITHFFAYCAWIYIALNRIYSKKLLLAQLVLILVSIYLSLVSSVNGYSIGAATFYITWAIELIPIAITISSSAKQRGFGFDFLISTLIQAALVESGFVYVAVISPDVQDYFIQMMVGTGGTHAFYEEWSFRTYGLASNLQFSSPIAMSSAALLAILRWQYTGNKSNIIIAAAIVPAAFINARTSLLIFLIGAILVLISKSNGIKGVIKAALTVGLVIAAMMTLVSFVPQTQLTIWLKDGLSDILSLVGISSDSIGQSTLDYFTSEARYQIPSSPLQILFGVGHTILAIPENGYSSDVGYINDIWFGGFAYVTILVIACCCILRSAYIRLAQFKGKSYARSLLLIILSVVILTNFKGLFFSYNNSSSFVLLLLVWVFWYFDNVSSMSEGEYVGRSS